MLTGSEAAAFGLEHHSKCIAPQLGETEEHKFLVGTLSLSAKGGENQVRLLNYDEASNSVDCHAVWQHPGEVWDISSCHSRASKDLFFTLWYREGQDKKLTSGATLWSMAGGAEDPLKELLVVDETCHKVLWDPVGLTDTVLLVEDGGLSVMKLDCAPTSIETSTCSIKKNGSIASGKKGQRPTGAWDPNHPDVAVMTAETSIKKCDLRSKEEVASIDNAHVQCVRDVQFNPSKIYQMVSGGDDGQCKVWDLRHTDAPMISWEAHDHMVYQTQFNPFHDQLMITSSSDTSVKLWELDSVVAGEEVKWEDLKLKHRPPMGSKPFQSTILKDASVSTVKEFKDYDLTVYNACWSAASSWVFGSVDFRGKILIHQVPKEIKNKILLANSDY